MKSIQNSSGQRVGATATYTQETTDATANVVMDLESGSMPALATEVGVGSTEAAVLVADLIGINEGVNKVSAFRLTAIVKGDGAGAWAPVGAASATVADEIGGGGAVSGNIHVDASGRPIVRVTGDADTNIKWRASMRATAISQAAV